MKEKGRKILLWAPRVLGILFAAFISMFALDVFGVGYTLWETLVALFMHLIPTYILIIVIILAWRWAWVGGALFIGLGVLYIAMAWGNLPFTAINSIALPAFLTGCLYLASWFTRPRVKADRS